jgi:hypothetical protein
MENFKPKMGEAFFYFKICGAVRGDVWSNHPLQRIKAERGMAPFRTRAEAEQAYKKSIFN